MLLTALPIILHLTTAQSFEWSLGIAVLLSFLSLYSIIRVQRWWRGLALVGLTLALGATGWLTRVMVPPATLWLTEVAVTPELDDHQRTPARACTPSPPPTCAATASTPTPRSTPRGLNERIYHLWRFEGKEVDRIALDIHGGRERATAPGPTSRTSPPTRWAAGRCAW